jgi:hypothetical protein
MEEIETVMLAPDKGRAFKSIRPEISPPQRAFSAVGGGELGGSFIHPFHRLKNPQIPRTRLSRHKKVEGERPRRRRCILINVSAGLCSFEHGKASPV